MRFRIAGFCAKRRCFEAFHRNALQSVAGTNAARLREKFGRARANFVYRRNMANDVADLTEVEGGGAEFVLSSQPIVAPEPRVPDALADYENLGELPRSYGGAFLFGIARDPHTLFVYWDIDWATVFGDTPPVDRKVHLRVLWHEGIEESTVAVEPLAGSHLLSATHARSSYR